MTAVLAGLMALGTSPWREMDADVRAEAVVAASPDEVTALLADLRRASALFPTECLTRWAFGVPSSGEGAMARVSYVPHWMNRRLTLTITEVDPGARVVWSHAGDLGFTTTFTVEAADGGARVRIATPLNGPPWPFGKMYQTQVKPAWDACYHTALRNLGSGA